MKEVILSKFTEFERKISDLSNTIEGIKQDRVNWCRENSNEIKKLFPQKNRVYKIKTKLTDSYRYSELTDDVYYFKVTNTRFNPMNLFKYGFTTYPTVKGRILDANLKEAVTYYYDDDEMEITNLEEISISPSNYTNKFTKVYVMFDMNTGYYKIGRSSNPEYRERTLQSEKPTIKLMFYNDARMKDEKVLHDKFKDKRIRGEWFDLSGSDIEQIKEYFENN